MINTGERGWTRTIDPCLKRALLCQLSYAPTLLPIYHKGKSSVHTANCPGNEPLRR